MSFLTETRPFGDLWEGGLDVRTEFCFQNSYIKLKYFSCRLYGVVIFVSQLFLLIDAASY